MSWGKLDDRYDDNQKVKRAWKECRAAVGLHVMAITYCCRHDVDGIVSADWIEEKIPKPAERKKAVDALVRHGLFEVVDAETFQIHDFLEFNESRESKMVRRERDRVRKSKGGSASRPSGVPADSARNPDGIHADSGSPAGASRPDPAHPVPPTTENEGGLSSQGGGGLWVDGDPGPEPPCNVFDLRDGKTSQERGVA